VLGLKKDFELAKGITIDDYRKDFIVHYVDGSVKTIMDMEMNEYLIATIDDYKAAARAARAENETSLQNKGGKLRKRTNKKRKQRRRKTSGRR